MPHFKHDCSRCRSLGSHTYAAPLINGTETRTVDLYHCPDDLGGSLIARFGADAPAYASLPVEIVQRRADQPGPMGTSMPALIEGLRRLNS